MICLLQVCSNKTQHIWQIKRIAGLRQYMATNKTSCAGQQYSFCHIILRISLGCSTSVPPAQIALSFPDILKTCPQLFIASPSSSCTTWQLGQTVGKRYTKYYGVSLLLNIAHQSHLLAKLLDQVLWQHARG